MSVVRRASPVVNNLLPNEIFSATTRHTALIFGMKHCLVDLYQVCSELPCGGGLGSKIIYIKQEMLQYVTNAPEGPL